MLVLIMYLDVNLQMHPFSLGCIEQREVTYASLLFEDETTPP